MTEKTKTTEDTATSPEVTDRIVVGAPDDLELQVSLTLKPGDWITRYIDHGPEWPDEEVHEPPPTLRDAIIHHAGLQLAREIRKEQEAALQNQVRLVREAVAAEVRDQVAPIVQEILSKPIPEMNTFGGVQKTETLEAMVLRCLKTKTHENGRRGGDATPIGHAVREALDKGLAEELADFKEIVAGAREKLRKEAERRMGEEMVKAMTER